MKPSEVTTPAVSVFVPTYYFDSSQNTANQGLSKNLITEISEPYPVIESFTNDGVISIKFNTPMVVPDVKEVQESKVALRWLGAVQREKITTE